MIHALTAGQLLYGFALLAMLIGFALSVTSRRVARRVRRWAYSPRRSFGTTRVCRCGTPLWAPSLHTCRTRPTTRDEALANAMRRHPAGSRR